MSTSDTEAIRNLQDFIDNLPKNLYRGMEYLCLHLVDKAQDECPWDTQNLRRSITYSVDVTNKKIRGVIGTPLEYGIWVHEGTGIYANGKSRAKKIPWYVPVEDMNSKKTYHWKIVYGKGGKRFYEIYGQKPNPFLTRTIDKNKKYILELFRRGYGL